MTNLNVRLKLLKDMEPAEPAETLMRVLVENEGKRLDKRIEKKLQDAIKDPGLRLSKSFGMTSIVTSDYQRTQGNSGVRLYVSHTCYFSAREARNKARELLLKTTIPDDIQRAVNDFEAAKADLDRFEDEFFSILPRLYDR